jgi:hypothetical protein
VTAPLQAVLSSTAEGVGGGGFLQVFLQYGALGAFAVVAVIFFNRAYKRESERADKAETALAELNRDLRDKVLPVLIAATQAVAEATANVRERR